MTFGYFLQINLQTQAQLFPIIRCWQGLPATRYFVGSPGEDGNWGALHLFLNSGGHRGDQNEESRRAEVTFQSISSSNWQNLLLFEKQSDS